MQEPKEAAPFLMTREVAWRERAIAAELSLENLRSYLERRLRDLDSGRLVSGHNESCQEIMDRVGFKFVPAQSLTVVKK